MSKIKEGSHPRTQMVFIHRRALLHQVNAYIEDHFDEPDLDPATVAAAHHASVRLPYKRFAAQGETVAGGIATQKKPRTALEYAIRKE